MKNPPKAYVCFLSSILLAGGLVGLGLVYNVTAQSLCGYGRGVGPCQEKEPQFPGSLNNDGGLQLGRRLSVCLMNGCTVLVGVIESIDIDQHKRSARTRFHISERLGANNDSNSGESDLYIGWSQKGDDTFFDVRLEPGTLLMIGKRPNTEPIDFALGNIKYFPSIRSTVLFHHQNNLRDSFASVLGPLRDQRDNVFAGYVSENVWRLATVGNMDENLDVLQKLFADPKLPPQNLQWIGYAIDEILRREGEFPSEPSREATVEKLLEIGSSSDGERAHQAVWVLENIADKEWFQPKKYITRAGAEKMLEIIHKTIGHADGPDLLEEKLLKIK